MLASLPSGHRRLLVAGRPVLPLLDGGAYRLLMHAVNLPITENLSAQTAALPNQFAVLVIVIAIAIAAIIISTRCD